MNCFQAVLSAERRTKTAFCLLAGRLCSDVKYSDDEMDEDEKDGREEVRVCVCGEMACVTSIVCGIGLPKIPLEKANIQSAVNAFSTTTVPHREWGK